MNFSRTKEVGVAKATPTSGQMKTYNWHLSLITCISITCPINFYTKLFWFKLKMFIDFWTTYILKSFENLISIKHVFWIANAATQFEAKKCQIHLWKCFNEAANKVYLFASPTFINVPSCNSQYEIARSDPTASCYLS